MTTKTLDLNNIERKFFWVLSTAIMIVMAFYLYSALVITVAGVDRSTMNRKTHELGVTSGALETEYLSLANGVTLAYAKGLGFHEVNAKFTTLGTGAKVAMAR